jgi:hypothetical protein
MTPASGFKTPEVFAVEHRLRETKKPGKGLRTPTFLAGGVISVVTDSIACVVGDVLGRRCIRTHDPDGTHTHTHGGKNGC